MTFSFLSISNRPRITRLLMHANLRALLARDCTSCIFWRTLSLFLRAQKGSVSGFPRLRRQIEEDARSRLNELLTDEDRQADAHAIALIAASPSAAIVGYATEIQADLIVMGTHGRTGKPLGVIGSVAEQVVRTAECPVTHSAAAASEEQIISASSVNQATGD